MDHLPSEHFQLPPGSELRIEVGAQQCFITVTSGSAEVFGAVLEPHRRVALQHTKLAVFTFEGCAITVDGHLLEPAYVSGETPMTSYLNASHVINNRRKAAREVRAGPVVVVVGPRDSGKTSVVKILTNYAIRCGWNPLLVETDVKKGLLSVPGTVAAAQVEVPIEPDEGVLADAPLVYFFGQMAATDNSELYKAQVAELARRCQEREQAYEGKFQNLAAGAIVDTMGWTDGASKSLQLFVCNAFKADVVLVIGSDKLYSAIQTFFQDSPGTEVVRLPKSGGVVTVSRDEHRRQREAAVVTYFYGLSTEMQPSLQRVKFANMAIYKPCMSGTSQPGLLPTEMVATMDATRMTKVEPSVDMVGYLLAVSYTEDPAKIALTNVAGFVWLQQVDFDDRSISIMCPHNSPPPTCMFMIGSVQRTLDL